MNNILKSWIPGWFLIYEAKFLIALRSFSLTVFLLFASKYSGFTLANNDVQLSISEATGTLPTIHVAVTRFSLTNTSSCEDNSTLNNAFKLSKFLFQYSTLWFLSVLNKFGKAFSFS